MSTFGRARWRGGAGWRLAATLSAVIVVSLFADAGLASALTFKTQPFAGTWNTTYNGGTGTGTINFIHQGDAQQGAQQLQALGGNVACDMSASGYFTGSYSTNEPDTGEVAGCTVTTDCSYLVGNYRSSQMPGVSGTFAIGISHTNLDQWSGSYTPSQGSGGTWSGTFVSDFTGDGDTDPCGGSTPVSPSASTPTSGHHNKHHHRKHHKKHHH